MLRTNMKHQQTIILQERFIKHWASPDLKMRPYISRSYIICSKKPQKSQRQMVK
jgi:hypothetical protein